MATTFAVPDGRVAMNTVLRNGFGTSGGSITSLNFQPDFIWEKRRNVGVSNHFLVDSVRGATKTLSSNITSVEATYNNYFISFNSNGYSLGVGDYTSTDSLVDWCWKAGGTAVSNTAGTITSSVSVNTTAGFSVVTYTGTLSAAGTATVGHGLGVAPAMVITKSRSAISGWIVHHTSLATPSYAFSLNATDTAADSSAYGTVAAPTNTVFTTNYVTGYNISGVTTVAYCWAPVAGYSAFGSYTGNNSTDGPFIYTGFRPRWILIKSSTVATSWYLLDSARETYNEEKIILYPDLAQADSPQAYGVDFLSNGFKIRAPTGYGLNNASATYIYAAFAENPLKYANAR